MRSSVPVKPRMMLLMMAIVCIFRVELQAAHGSVSTQLSELREHCSFHILSSIQAILLHCANLTL